MNYNSISRVALLIIFALGGTAAAQINITIPKLPKIKKPTVEQPTTTTATTTNGDEPYDTGAFDRIKWGNNELLKPYLGCYAKKHNLELIKVTDNAFRERGFENGKEMKRVLEEEKPQLLEIGRQLKSQLKSRPNTGKTYHENPAIWEEIIDNVAEYMPCAVAGEQSRRTSESVYMKMYLEDIKKMQKEVDEYNPAARNYFVSVSTADYLLFAVSKRERAKWLTDSEEFKLTLDPLLDALAASAAEKLPLYKPGATGFKFRDAAAEKQLMSVFKNPATIKVHRIGVGSAGWEIQKDSYGLLPSYRFKYANVYYRDSSDDHPYCRVASVRVKQDYAGGGRYSTETYRSSAEFGLIGCPAGK